MNVRLVNKEQFITRDEGEKTELRKKVQFYLFPVPPYLHSSNLYWISVYTFKLPQPHNRIWKMPCHLFSCLHQWKNYPFILWIIINCDYFADSAAYGHWSAWFDKNNIPKSDKYKYIIINNIWLYFFHIADGSEDDQLGGLKHKKLFSSTPALSWFFSVFVSDISDIFVSDYI